MSLNFSIDRILSPDFGPCKSRAFDSTTNTCSHSGLPVDRPQSMCKSEDFSNKKLSADKGKDFVTPPLTEMRANAAVLSLISATDFQFYYTGKSKLDTLQNGQRTDISMLPRKIMDQDDLENLNHTYSSPDYSSVKSSSGKQSEPLANVVNLIEGIFGQKTHGLTSGKSFQPSADYSERSNTPESSRSPSLAGEAVQSNPPSAKNALAATTKETTSSPKKDEGLRDLHQLLSKPLHQTDNTDTSYDTKPQVPEELLLNDNRWLSTDGRCSSSSVDTLSSTPGNESSQEPTTDEKVKLNQTKTVVKEPWSYECVDSPPTTCSDINIQPSSIPNQKLLSDDLGGIIPPPGKEWPVWVFCNRYSARPSSGPRSRRQSRKLSANDERRCRTAFTMSQLSKLHRAFESSPYLCEKRRNELARDLQLSESQIKIWFQNRRAKVKKATGTKNPLADLLKEQGLYNHSTAKVEPLPFKF